MSAPLSMKERELVATGASVAAGCVPCTQFHAKAVRDADATDAEITRAIEVALAVKHGTEAVMRRVADDALGAAGRTGCDAVGVPARDARVCCVDDVGRETDRMTELVAIAAAVAVNCGTSFRCHVERGRAAGVHDDEIQLVVTFARMIRAKATHHMDEATGGLSTLAAADACAAPAATERHGAPVATERPGTAAATATATCCGG